MASTRLRRSPYLQGVAIESLTSSKNEQRRVSSSSTRKALSNAKGQSAGYVKQIVNTTLTLVLALRALVKPI